jgi:hypothetical protein
MLLLLLLLLHQHVGEVVMAHPELPGHHHWLGTPGKAAPVHHTRLRADLEQLPQSSLAGPAAVLAGLPLAAAAVVVAAVAEQRPVLL